MRLSRYLPTLPQTHSVAVFVGAMARGRDDFADHVVDEKISISDYPLSASVACGKVCFASCFCLLAMLRLSHASWSGMLTTMHPLTVLLRARGALGHRLRFALPRSLLDLIFPVVFFLRCLSLGSDSDFVCLYLYGSTHPKKAPT